MDTTKKKLAFIFHHEFPQYWKDGLWAALNLLEHDITWHNLEFDGELEGEYDLYLGWGAANSPADKYIRKNELNPAALFVAGSDINLDIFSYYKLLFVETAWHEKRMGGLPIQRAFGTNTDIYFPEDTPKVFDYIYPAAYAHWKNFSRFREKSGTKLVVGQQKSIPEAQTIKKELKQHGVLTLPMINPEALAELYRASKTVYIPSTVMGGGERAILEGLACGCEIEVENEKLQGLLEEAKEYIPNQHDYAEAINEGIKWININTNKDT